MVFGKSEAKKFLLGRKVPYKAAALTVNELSRFLSDEKEWQNKKWRVGSGKCTRNS